MQREAKLKKEMYLFLQSQYMQYMCKKQKSWTKKNSFWKQYIDIYNENKSKEQLALRINKQDQTTPLEHM